MAEAAKTIDDYTDAEQTQKGAANEEDALADSLWDEDFLQLLRDSEKRLLEIDDSRAALAANKQVVMAKLAEKGLNRDAVKAAIKYFRTPDDKREKFDLSYQITRKALGVPVQDDLFVAAAQKQIDNHQAAAK